MKARYIVIPVSLIVLVAATVFFWTQASNQQIQYDLFEVRRGTVAKTISVSGSITSRQKLELGFLSPGIVEEVYVSVGDRVEAGDILIALDSTLLRQQSASAAANVSVARAMLNKLQNSLRGVDRNVLSQTFNQAKIALDVAQSNLWDAQQSKDIDINSAITALNGAQTAYNNTVNAYNAAQLSISQSAEVARVALINIETALSSAQANYNLMINLYNTGQATMFELQQAQLALSNANAAYQSAKAGYDATLYQVSVEKMALQSNLDAVYSQLKMAHNTYDAALMGSDVKINSARNALSSTQSAYELALARYNQAVSPAHSADIDSASAQIKSSQAVLGTIQAQISQSRIKAPVDGMITAVNLHAGELSGLAGPVIVLETINDLLIEANISEFDIEQVKIGQDVQIQFDAIDNLITRGEIVSIDPAATVILGIINYKITIALENNLDILRPSMTADLDILTQKKEDVIFVPRKVLSKQDNKYTVDILTSDGKQEIVVEVGLIGDSEVEIISGLKENDQIILAEL